MGVAAMSPAGRVSHACFSGRGGGRALPTAGEADQQRRHHPQRPPADPRQVHHVEVDEERQRQNWPASDVSVSSPRISAAYVMANIVATGRRQSVSAHGTGAEREPARDALCRKVYGIVSRFDWKVSKPRFRSDSVRYCSGGDMGIQKHMPSTYTGLVFVGGLNHSVSFSVESSRGSGVSPHVVVAQALPEQRKRQRFARVHRALARVLADEPVDDDLLLAVWGARFSPLVPRANPSQDNLTWEVH